MNRLVAILAPSAELRAACAFVVWAALLWAASPPGLTQTMPLADSSAWEVLGDPTIEPEVEADVFAFVGDPDNPTIWVGDSNFFALEPNSGAWVVIQRSGFPDNILFVGDDPLEPDTVFYGGSLYRSTDGGGTYRHLEDPDIDDGSGNITVGDVGSIDRIPFSAPHHAGRFVAGDPPDLVYSDDGGDSWTRTANASPTVRIVFSVKALRSGRVLAAGFWGAVLSDDGGELFEPIEALYDSVSFRFDLHKITVLDGLVTGQPGDSEQGRVVLTGAEGGANGGYFPWTSDDEGTTWARHPTPGGDPTAEGVPLVPLGEAEGGETGWVVAATSRGRVMLSTDGAETWAQVGSVPGTYIAGGRGRVDAAALGPDGKLYVGVGINGPTDAWQYRTAGRLIDAVRVAVPSEPVLSTGPISLRVRPNPSRQHVRIELSGSTPEGYRFVVVDSVGRAVARAGLVAGSSWTVDVSTWAPGVYHARVEGGAVEPVPFTVIR